MAAVSLFSWFNLATHISQHVILIRSHFIFALSDSASITFQTEKTLQLPSLTAIKKKRNPWGTQPHTQRLRVLPPCRLSLHTLPNLNVLPLDNLPTASKGTYLSNHLLPQAVSVSTSPPPYQHKPTLSPHEEVGITT